MSLLSLPNELLEQIIVFYSLANENSADLPKGSQSFLLALCLTCARLRAIVQPRLHRHFCFPFREQCYPVADSLLEYTRTLVERPDLAAKSTHVEVALLEYCGWQLSCTHDPDQDGYDEHDCEFKGPSRNFSGTHALQHTEAFVRAIGESTLAWAEDFSGFEHKDILPLLLSKTTALESLYVSWTTDDGNILDTMTPLLMMLATNTSISTGPTPPYLTNLKSLYLEVRHNDYKGFTLSEISPLLHLPSLARLAIRNCIDAGQVLHLESNSCNLLEIDIRKSSIQPKSFNSLIAACRQLKVLKYFPCEHPSERGPSAMTTGELILSLQTHQPHIETLDLNFGSLYRTHHSLMPAKLQSFPNLSKVSFDQSLLNYTGDMNCLPSSLETLIITACVRDTVAGILKKLVPLWNMGCLPNLALIKLTGFFDLSMFAERMDEFFAPANIAVVSHRVSTHEFLRRASKTYSAGKT